MNFTIEYGMWVAINSILFLFVIEFIWSHVTITKLKRKYIKLHEEKNRQGEGLLREIKKLRVKIAESKTPPNDFTEIENTSADWNKNWTFKKPMQVLPQRKLKVKSGKSGKSAKKKTKAKK